MWNLREESLVIGRVKKQIYCCKRHLVKSFRCNMKIFALNFLFNQIFWHFLPSFHMLAHPFHYVLVPNPVFEHLTWHFYKIFFDRSTCKPGEIGFITHIMHNMPKFMEECNDLTMAQSNWFTSLSGLKVTYHCCRCRSNLAALILTPEKSHACSVIKLVWSWV